MINQPSDKIFLNSGLYTNELNIALRLVQLMNGRKLDIVLSTRKCLHSLVHFLVSRYTATVIIASRLLSVG